MKTTTQFKETGASYGESRQAGTGKEETEEVSGSASGACAAALGEAVAETGSSTANAATSVTAHD
jgi:hypothetical protein